MTIVFQSRDLPGTGCAVVPTMGALHRGHASLIRIARERCPDLPCVVTVFVNPTQFNERSDYERYPRDLEADARLAREAGAEFVFAPAVDEVYPGGPAAHALALPRVAFEPGLEDRHRPGHFAGVCQVVKRLLLLTRARSAVFGEKDWQQLQVVRALCEQDGLGTVIVPAPIVRDDDGLALSSRNVFLTPEQRVIAAEVPRALSVAAREQTPAAGERVLRERLGAHSIPFDYAVARDARTLGPVTPGAPARLLVTARVGTVRLLDNMPMRGAD